MEILDECEAFLSDFEIFEHLTLQKKNREQAFSNRKKIDNIRELGPQNVLTIEFEVALYFNLKVLRYFDGMPASKLTSTELIEYLSNLSKFNLTKSERLQMINSVPKTNLDLHVVRYVLFVHCR